VEKAMDKEKRVEEGEQRVVQQGVHVRSLDLDFDPPTNAQSGPDIPHLQGTLPSPWRAALALSFP